MYRVPQSEFNLAFDRSDLLAVASSEAISHVSQESARRSGRDASGVLMHDIRVLFLPNHHLKPISGGPNPRPSFEGAKRAPGSCV